MLRQPAVVIPRVGAHFAPDPVGGCERPALSLRRELDLGDHEPAQPAVIDVHLHHQPPIRQRVPGLSHAPPFGQSPERVELSGMQFDLHLHALPAGAMLHGQDALTAAPAQPDFRLPLDRQIPLLDLLLRALPQPCEAAAPGTFAPVRPSACDAL